MTKMSEWTTNSADSFKVASPWSPDRLPARPDTSQAVTCSCCSRRFLNEEWLGKHVDEGHGAPRLRDIEDALTPAYGRDPAHWQLLARKVRDQVVSGDLKPGDELPIRTFHAESSRGIAQRAFSLLAEHGVLRKTGEKKWTRYWVPSPVPEPGAE